MCGITGVVHLDGGHADRELLQRMTAAIAHRGPDGEGHHLDGPVGLGHRRLAVIDLTDTGRQPMSTPDGRFTIVYNGEVYNYRELRTSLSRSYDFVSSSDTEVVLAALANHGVDALPMFNGMFALALWDHDRRELLLARDRYGIKPLYYATVGDTLLFGSEVKALLSHPACQAKMDSEGLVEYLTFQNFFTDRTLFAGVRLLPPGTFIRARPTGGHVDVPSRYWDFSFNEPDDDRDVDGYLDELDRLFRQAVLRQLVSDVPVNAYLSGGMDSGSITAIAAGCLPNLRTFTVGFDLHSASGIEIGFDERSRAEHMSYLLQTEHYEMVLKAGDMERILPKLVWHLEEPRIGQSYPNFYAAHLASRFGKVVLSGAGGDELFGGYPWRYYRAVVNDDFDHYIEQYFGFWQRLVPGDALPQLIKPIGGSDTIDVVAPRSIFAHVFPDHWPPPSRPEDYVHHSLYLEAKTFLHAILVVEDKLSMAHGLETRVPFLDNDLVDFAGRVPARMKLGRLTDLISLNENELSAKARELSQQPTDGKWLLRRAMERYLPVEVTERKKQGFSGPDASWFRGESIDYVRRLLLQSDALIYEYLDRATVRSLVDDHLHGRENRRLLIWSLVCLEHWCRLFLDGESADHVG